MMGLVFIEEKERQEKEFILILCLSVKYYYNHVDNKANHCKSKKMSNFRKGTAYTNFSSGYHQMNRIISNYYDI